MLNDSPLHEFFPDGLMGTIATYTYSASGARWELHLGRAAFLGCVACTEASELSRCGRTSDCSLNYARTSGFMDRFVFYKCLHRWLG